MNEVQRDIDDCDSDIDVSDKNLDVIRGAIVKLKQKYR